jgi:hypothetical protein
MNDEIVHTTKDGCIDCNLGSDVSIDGNLVAKSDRTYDGSVQFEDESVDEAVARFVR